MRVAALLLLVAALAGGVSAARGASPEFHAKVKTVRWDDLRFTYRDGCPVTPPQLRTLEVLYWDFAGNPKVGRIVVARRVADDVVHVFRELWAKRFPIRRLQPISAYRGDDDASMAADNTSGFNCRRVYAGGPWSAHAYGLAIDLNPVENPYVHRGVVEPPAGRRYLNRAKRRRGMVVAGGAVVRAFAAIGWPWGGHWTSSKDYQHFSATGR
jgi:D-alanyl-D-alanine carboxypeptidase